VVQFASRDGLVRVKTDHYRPLKGSKAALFLISTAFSPPEGGTDFALSPLSEVRLAAGAP